MTVSRLVGYYDPRGGTAVTDTTGAEPGYCDASGASLGDSPTRAARDGYLWEQWDAENNQRNNNKQLNELFFRVVDIRFLDYGLQTEKTRSA